MYDKKECGNRIRRLREATGKTQKEVAKEAQISVDTICKIEQGKRCPSIMVVDVLRKYYNTTSDYIIYGDMDIMELCKSILKNVPAEKRADVEHLMENIKDII
ncbi:MAG: helix-turn-helix domain-containing protein [Muribaculaceae bacterium]|nr:helix-turn-helix domain-containing protein [Muribaculaceae bacterium]MCM1398999.1 helix-turn-helix domain-containing protein [Clostridium sp.]MCM1458857.1 helix-turn-helix domain-containing protein [Bacteroides sp.]